MTLSTMSGSREYGIPTTYRETRFRSRLEARWAAFFDLVGWSWVYEPFDLAGYVPDFLIQGPRPLLVEVGPCATALDYERKAEKGMRALLEAGSILDYLVVGISPITEIDSPYMQPLLVAGLLDEGYWRAVPVNDTGVVETGEFGPIVPADCGWGIWGRCLDCHELAIVHESGSYDSRPCGFTGHSGGWPDEASGRRLADLWATAGNAVQWKRSA